MAKVAKLILLLLLNFIVDAGASARTLVEQAAGGKAQVQY